MAGMASIEAERRITEQLESGERILWTGVPRQGFLFRQSDLLLVPFSLLWGGFAVFWEVMALRTRGPAIFPVFGIPFVLVGLYLIFGRFLFDMRVRSRTAYGLTDRRIVIVTGGRSRSILTLPLRTLSEIQLEVRADGSGTITFGALRPADRQAAAFSFPGMARPGIPRFELIPSAKEVHGRIRDAQGSVR